jgi:ABC-type amino acid transport system permease subunit
LWGDIPEAAMQLALSALCVLAAGWWIKRFLDSRRTPAGLAKLTDDDYFRMIFAAVGALVGIVVIYVLWPGLSSWIINSGADFWHWLGAKFGGGRGTRPLDAMKPSLSEGRFVNYAPTGLTMTAFFASLFFGLVFYTSSFIAEIVRGGILAVPKGQSEAAAALGLSRMQSLRKVVLPQAFRVIMPPLGNQYLNITKNTSLGIAVGFSEIVQVGQTVYNKNNQTLAVFSIYMVFFLACSLTISLIVNFINHKLAIVER